MITHIIFAVALIQPLIALSPSTEEILPREIEIPKELFDDVFTTEDFNEDEEEANS